MGLNCARLDLTGSALLGNNPCVIPFRVAKTLCALAAILGLTGLSVLPPEHVHGGPSDAASHRGHVIHRHFAPHHTGHQEIAGGPSAGQTLNAGADDDDARTIQLFFTAATRPAKHHAPSVAVQSDTDPADVPTGASSEVSSHSPEPDISPPPGLTASLRAPPVLS